jgi:hypothetical protein
MALLSVLCGSSAQLQQVPPDDRIGLGVDVVTECPKPASDGQRKWQWAASVVLATAVSVVELFSADSSGIYSNNPRCCDRLVA